jgi:hypothetical protein
MKITLRAGEHFWSNRGTHVCDEMGFSLILAEDAEVEIDDDVVEHALSVIKADREFRGVDIETGLPIPEPEVAPVEEQPVEEQPVEEQ